MRSQFPLPCLAASPSQAHVEISPECVPMHRISHLAPEENPIRWQRLRCTFVPRSQQLQSPPRKKNPAGFPPFGSPMVPSSFTARSTNTPPKSGRTNSLFSALTSWPRIPYVAIRMKDTAQYKTLRSSVESRPFHSLRVSGSHVHYRSRSAWSLGNSLCSSSKVMRRFLSNDLLMGPRRRSGCAESAFDGELS